MIAIIGKCVVAMAGLKKMDQLLFALVCMAVVPLVNGKPYSISACNETLSINSNVRLRVTFPSVRTGYVRSTVDLSSVRCCAEVV